MQVTIGLVITERGVVMKGSTTINISIRATEIGVINDTDMVMVVI